MWDERYSKDEYAYGTEPNEFLVQFCDSIPKGKVLCLAEGEGRNAVYLAEQGYHVLAVDASRPGIEKAQRLASMKNVHIDTVVEDLKEFQIEEGEFDAIVSIFCHLPPELRIKVHQQVVKGLKPGGVLLLEAYTPEQLNYKTGGPPVVEMMMQLDQLLQEFKELKVIHAKQLVRDVVEGMYHTGSGAVVQLVAVKE